MTKAFVCAAITTSICDDCSIYHVCYMAVSLPFFHEIFGLITFFRLRFDVIDLAEAGWRRAGQGRAGQIIGNYFETNTTTN